MARSNVNRYAFTPVRKLDTPQWHLKLHFGSIFLVTGQKGYSSRGEILHVIRELQKTVQRLDHGMCVEDQLEVAELQFLDLTLSRSHWEFTPSTELIRMAQPCVYFLHAFAEPDYTKIGMSNHLSKRLSSIRAPMGRRRWPLHVDAYVETPYNWRIEQTLHGLFDSNRYDGEWFHSEPVLNFIETYRR